MRSPPRALLAASLVAVLLPAGLLRPPATGAPTGQTATPGATPGGTPTSAPVAMTALLPIVALGQPLPWYQAYAPSFGYNDEELAGTGWWSGLTIANLVNQPSIVIAFAWPDYIATAVVPPFGTLTLFPRDFAGMSEGYRGSVVVGSNGRFAAAVTMTNRPVGWYGVAGGLAKGEYEVVDSTRVATTTYYPQVKHCYPGDCANPQASSSRLFVQNAGDRPTTVSAQYTCADGQTYHWTTVWSIEPVDRVSLSPAQAGVPPGQLCAARVAAGEPLAVVVGETYPGETVATRLETTRALGDHDLSRVLYAPVFKKRVWTNPPNAQRTTAAIVQNAGITAATVTAVYRGAGGSCPPPWSWSESSPPLAPGATYTFSSPLGMPDDCLAAATFSAAGDLLGVAREAYLDPEPPPGTQATTVYHLLPASSASLQLGAIYYEKAGGRTSALHVQNTGPVTATLQLEFRRGADRWRTVEFAVASGAGRAFYLVSEQPIWSGAPLPPDTRAQVFALADQPIVAVAAELSYPDCYGQGGGPCYDRKDSLAFDLHVRPAAILEASQR